MIFAEGIPFAEALQHERVKRLLPADATSAELNRLPAELRARARFSAGVTDARILSFVDEQITQVVSPESVLDAATGRLRPALPGEYVDKATFRVKMQQLLTQVGYSPDQGAEGTLRDLFAERRQDVIWETNLRMAHEYGYWEQGQDEAVLDQWPCSELFRAESRINPRAGFSSASESSYWGGVWQSEGGKLYRGRMIALKDDGIWRRISHFGQPYPPFHFNSGMGVRDVDREEAIDLGVIKESAKVKPQTQPLNEDLEASVEDVPQSLLDSVLEVFKGQVAINAGRLILRA